VVLIWPVQIVLVLTMICLM